MVTIDAVRDIKFFAGLTDDQYTWLAGITTPRSLRDGEVLFRDGDPGTHFYVLAEGELVITKVIDGREEELTRHSSAPRPSDQHDGKPSAAHQFTGELPLLAGGEYIATATAVGPTVVFPYSKAEFFDMLVRCPPIATTLLPVLAWRIRASEAQARGRATVTAMGTLAAGLAHELNNPAAAVASAAHDLCPAIDRLDTTVHAWTRVAGTDEQDALHRTVREALDAGPATPADPLDLADAEDAITGWAATRGAGAPDTVGSVLAGRGLTVDWLRERVGTVDPNHLGAGLDYLGAVLEARLLTEEVRAAGQRISHIVAAARDYTNLNRAPMRTFAVTDGIEATLRILRPKLGAVRIVRDYSSEVPAMTGYPSELNQVWTNLIDNAVDAMGGSGTLTIRTCTEGDSIIVEISDTGPGIPADIQSRIFEPFFTTKDVGKGTGLGLHLSYRIVTQRHRGSLTVRSLPGDTRMIVRIPQETGRNR